MKRKSLNVKDYVKNAAKHFSFTRLFIYLFVSLALTIGLLLSILKGQYEGVALTFSMIALLLIAGYSVMNILAIVKKIKEK